MLVDVDVTVVNGVGSKLGKLEISYLDVDVSCLLSEVRAVKAVVANAVITTFSAGLYIRLSPSAFLEEPISMPSLQNDL